MSPRVSSTSASPVATGSTDGQRRPEPGRQVLESDLQPGQDRGRRRRRLEVKRAEDLLDGVRVGVPRADADFSPSGVQADVRLSYGASEAKIPDIADCVVDITETGRVSRRRPACDRHDPHQLPRSSPTRRATPTRSSARRWSNDDAARALDTRGKVLLKVNVSAEHRDAVIAVLPSAKSPTVNQLANGDYAIESVVPKAGINLVIPALTEAGATDLLEIPISKIVH